MDTLHPRCVQVVEIAAMRLPSRTMQTRSDSRVMRVPDGNSSGLPAWKTAGCPYVTRGLKKMMLDKAASTAEPNRPTLDSQASSLLRGIESSGSPVFFSWFETATAIVAFLLG